MWGFSGGSVVGNPPSNIADTSLSPWSRMNPHVSEQLRPFATATEPVFYSLEAATVEPMYCNY